jgi:hypothetical protein
MRLDLHRKFSLRQGARLLDARHGPFSSTGGSVSLRTAKWASAKDTFARSPSTSPKAPCPTSCSQPSIGPVFDFTTARSTVCAATSRPNPTDHGPFSTTAGRRRRSERRQRGLGKTAGEALRVESLFAIAQAPRIGMTVVSGMSEVQRCVSTRDDIVPSSVAVVELQMYVVCKCILSNPTYT